MTFEETVINIIISLISGILGGTISSVIIIKKQKQVNKNESLGIQIGELHETKK